jgi:hypothetical protein
MTSGTELSVVFRYRDERSINLVSKQKKVGYVSSLSCKHRFSSRQCNINGRRDCPDSHEASKQPESYKTSGSSPERMRWSLVLKSRGFGLVRYLSRPNWTVEALGKENHGKAKHWKCFGDDGKGTTRRTV